MSAPCPLEVMDAAIGCREIRVAWPGESIAELADARAAVADLVEADREYDAAQRAMDYANALSDASGFAEARKRLNKAFKRRYAALAKFGGAP